MQLATLAEPYLGASGLLPAECRSPSASSSHPSSASRASNIPAEVDAVLDLFDVGAHLASPGTSRFAGVDAQRIAGLEQSIDAMERELAPLTNFILPGGSLAAAHLHVARTVCRRAERRVVSLRDESPATLSTIAYLNRLSDYLFVAARFANLRANVQDVEWKTR